MIVDSDTICLDVNGMAVAFGKKRSLASTKTYQRIVISIVNKLNQVHMKYRNGKEYPKYY